ncbi:two-component system response regulator [Scytonema hofmannii PCC 7110]|uniref:Two-component system response regulator n=1 Tax=Scytonema hofmannii PCC 7110 TaxID=128403 RepID=A0A139XGU7_9CYAN|nr:response regulator [Scytonema hofmannii]KYC43889.1 two-component system response regulator [Scytonema hofmannii PCC 7110]
MAAKLLSAKQKRQSQQTRRILLIEDNDANRMLLSDYLSYHSYNVQSLAEASNFFSTIAEFQPELILLDLKLPDIDGYVLLEQIQQQPQLAKIPIIVVSAFAFRADRERAMELGVRRYFVKPINLSHLMQAIQEEFACLSI